MSASFAARISVALTKKKSSARSATAAFRGAVLPGGDEDTCALLASYGADEVLRCGGGEQPDEAVLAAVDHEP